MCNPERYNAEEEYLHEAIAALQKQYARAAKPYIDRLVAIQSMKSPPPMFISVEQATLLGLKVKDK